MPKLNTTIDNIELKSNKVTASVPSSAWTDAQYPSAKALYNAYTKLLNAMHPIGSIITTSTNTNPSSTLGGTWTLADKAFRSEYVVLDGSQWTKANADLICTTEASTAARVDHTINIRLKIQPTVNLTDSDFKLGTLNLPALGVERLHYSILYGTAQSDGGQCQVSYSVDYNTGVITSHDAINLSDGSHSMEAGQFFFIEINTAIPHGLMIEDFCDKFYWKRTA